MMDVMMLPLVFSVIALVMTILTRPAEQPKDTRFERCDLWD